MIKAVIFDFYGVFQADVYETWLHTNGLKRVGIYEDLAKQIDTGTIDRQQFLTALSQAIGRPVHNDELYNPPIIDSSLVAIVQSLKPHYKIGLLSNASAASLYRTLESSGLLQLFDEITVSGDVGITKPDTRIYQLLLDKIQVAANEILYIDDNPVYLKPAEVLGMTVLHFVSTEELLRVLNDQGILI